MSSIFIHVLLIVAMCIAYFLLAYSLNKVLFSNSEKMLSKAESLNKETYNLLTKFHDYEQKLSKLQAKKS